MNHTFPNLYRSSLETLQVNLGYKCNQTCQHCHVNAGPNRIEMMDSVNIERIPRVIHKYNIRTLDITGGAPEMHERFKWLINIVRDISDDLVIIDRCNLTILNEKGYEGLVQFLADKNVKIIASLPCYEQKNVDKQRGTGVFERSISALQDLNKIGYGLTGEKLQLDLVYNPIGPILPPPQNSLEEAYKEKLKRDYNIYFNKLLTITNMPINRFANYLKKSGKLDSYYQLLIDNYNSSNLDSVMCKSLISIDWKGQLYDCDFNQQLGIRTKNQQMTTLSDMEEHYIDYVGEPIGIGKHCYGCTAGTGSSCGGSLS